MSVISFDCWGTLIKSSPTFVKEKNNLIRSRFGVKDDAFVDDCFKSVKRNFNSIIESTGWQPTKELLFSHLINTLNNGFIYPKQYDIDAFCKEYQLLALAYPPSVYSEETEMYLKLFQNKGKLIIVSNTLFIEGQTLSIILDNMGLGQYFSDVIFSDQFRMSKPNPNIFMDSCFHVGDNLVTDGIKTPKRDYFIINSNTKTIKDAYNFFIQRG